MIGLIPFQAYTFLKPATIFLRGTYIEERIMNKTPKNLIDDFFPELETCDGLFDDFVHRYAKLKVYGDSHTIKIKEPLELYEQIINMVQYYKNGGV